MGIITVDEEACTKCGVCSKVCASRIITPAGKDTLPSVEENMSGMCIECGHCESFCPQHALVLNLRPEERSTFELEENLIEPDDLGNYLRMRRSIRNFTAEPVQKETILEMLDIARYAASGGNGQPVEWIVVHDRKDVHKVAELTVEWLRTLQVDGDPMRGFTKPFIDAWDSGTDIVCRGAPHLLVAHVPVGSQSASVDGIIALTHFDLAAPAFGVGTCWAGFVSMAAKSYEPLREFLGIPAGRTYSYGILFGNPKYTPRSIPRRNPLQVTWL